jgi:hypothetical protein
MKIKRDKWVWMPHPAHFIYSSYCRFVMATKVGKYIVSTVGEYWPDRKIREIHAEICDLKWFKENKHRLGDDFDHAYMKKFGCEDIGADRKYETIVFKAKKSEKDISCCPYRIIVNKDLDFMSYNKAEEAFKGHYKLCNKFSNK